MLYIFYIGYKYIMKYVNYFDFIINIFYFGSDSYIGG